MTKATRRMFALLVIGAAAAWSVQGCQSVLPTVTIPIALGSAASFGVESGVPSAKSFTTNFDTGGITVGRGSIELPPSVISIEPADAGKVLQSATCGDACDLANVSESTCNSVCNLGQISVTAHVGAFDEMDTVCTSGDAYGPYLVALDGENNPISVSPPSVTLQPKTIAAINAGAASFCIEVISPIGGTVIVNSISLNAGL